MDYMYIIIFMIVFTCMIESIKKNNRAFAWVTVIKITKLG